MIEDGVDGFLVNPYNVQEICNKMNYVADNLDKLKEMRTIAANKIKDNFSENIIVDKLENYYKKMIVR